VNIYSIKEKGLVNGSKRRIEMGVKLGVKLGVELGIERGVKKRKCAGLTGSQAHFSLL